MAKGTVSKETITSKILELFPNSFINEKEIRIPMVEDGVEVQIKCVLTCAKVNVEPGADSAIPGVIKKSDAAPAFIEAEKIEATEEEKNAISNLMAELNLDL